MKITYCAIFKKCIDGGYEVTFPDIFGGVTCGDSFDDAKVMAEDLLKIMYNDAKGQCFPPKTKDYFLKNIKNNEQIVEITIEL